MKNKTANKDQSGIRSRSGAYPLLALPPAIELAKKLFENFGAGPYSRDNLAKGLGYASFSGAASGKIGAMVHFGLLSRQSGSYLVTPLAREVFEYPREGSEVAIMEAARHPSLYAKLIARFSGETLPKGLPQILAADFRITEKAAAAATENFLTTMEFTGMARGGKLSEPDPLPPDRVSAPLLPETSQNGVPRSDSVVIALPSGIEISFPARLSYRLSMGEFADQIRDLEKGAGGVE